MSFTKITEGDLINKGVTGLADTPNLSTMEMQAKFDELSKDVIVPKFNELSEELDNKGLEKATISEDITNFRLDEDGRMQVSTDGGETYGYAGSTGHTIMDGSGTSFPARARIQFSSNVQITDNEEGNKTFLSFTGQKGDKGDAATITVGEVEKGEYASVENVGSSQDAIFNFVIPQGEDGDAATIQVGTVTSGDNVSITNRGTSSAAIFDFVLPKGEKGEPGTGLTLLDTYATYAELIAAHPTGQRGQAYYVGNSESGVVYLWSTTQNAWENVGELKGQKGDQGDAATVTIGTVTEGSTVAVENVGTSTEAILNFTLKKGDKGDTGNTGTISVGTVQSGETAAVVNVGTPTAAIFNFTIPKGEQGQQGSPTVVNGKGGASITLFGSDIYEDDSEDAKTINERVEEAEEASADAVDAVEGLSADIGDAEDLPNPLLSTNENIAELNQSLVTQNNQHFRFGYDSTSQKYGYILKEADTDVFVPFKNGIGNFSYLSASDGKFSEITLEVGKDYLLAYTANTSTAVFTFTNCTYEDLVPKQSLTGVCLGVVKITPTSSRVKVTGAIRSIIAWAEM